jgi:hypothetical protein
MVIKTTKLGMGYDNDKKTHQSKEKHRKQQKKWLGCDMAQEICSHVMLHNI